ncbi:cation channel sperm-associated auxiliary subunit epsilon-like [Xyrauchen texanus]|uniref:cation channel sperm-associated auxiliary subunit epsilon-like n=1 Tax=Xyrauchen texanus TaxID=154827 RepID=UPI0022422CEB|nr:cation channel sperm-associated auxiliary subunit epsilon-like [Xyrauchen texanus]
MFGFLGVVTCLLLTHFHIGDGVWRYKNTFEEKELYTTHSAFFLEYEGSSFLEWQYPESCDVNNKSLPNAAIWCESSGFATVKPLVSVREEERHLYISDSFFRFSWYAVIPELRNASESDSQIVRIWIIDPDRAERTEIYNTALVPSIHSRYLTKQFLISGAYPVIESSSSSQTVQSYFTNQGFWEARLLGNPEYHSFCIFGQSVSFHGQCVVSSRHTFYMASPEKPYGDREVSLYLPTGSQLSLVWGVCTPYRALLLSEKGTFMTKNAFLTYEEVKVDPGDLHVPAEGYFTIFEAALLENALIFRVGDALLWRDNKDRILRMNPNKLLDHGVKGLNFRTQCVDYYPLQDFELASVLAWKDHELYVGGKSLDWQNNNNYMTKVLSLPKTATILTASFGSHPEALDALVMYTHNDDPVRLSLITFYETEGIWRSSTFLSNLKEQDALQGPFQMFFVGSALETLLVWNKDVMLYSFHNNSEWGYMQPTNFSSLSQAANGSHIHQVVMDHSWNMLIKMENNALFFCKAGINKLLRLPTWIDSGSSMVLYLNQKNQIDMLILSDSGLHVQKYPLLMEIRSAMRGGVHVCPFIGFTHKMKRRVYFMDKGDRKELWAQIVYHVGKRIDVKLHMNNKHLLQITSRTHFESVRGVETINKGSICFFHLVEQCINMLFFQTFIIYQETHLRSRPNNSGLISQSSGTVSMELLPTQIGNACYLPKNQVSHLLVGCPPNRHIRVVKPQEIPCEMHTFEKYTIPGSVLRNPKLEDLLVHYDWKRIGCVLKINYKAAFRPDIDLYDGDTFVHSVDANFIVWEKFGRKDYYFNATMQQVACLHEAQTWKSMLVDKKHSEEAWGPHNYRSCFVHTSKKLGNLDQPYEIMNKSSRNYLTFSQKDSATYVFIVKILDPNYSFCDLRAVFAVKTYGIKIKDQRLPMYVVLILTCITLIMLCLIFYKYVTVFRNMLRKKHL